MPMRFLPLSPRALRFFVVALALLQGVASTWHICALGGHAARHKTAHHAAALVARDQNAPRQPVICVCSAPVQPLDPRTPRLDGVSHGDHATCLALLLGAMPAQLGAAPALFESRALISSAFGAPTPAAPSFAAPHRYLGRAPPQIC